MRNDRNLSNERVERLFKIVTKLLEKEKVTANELAKWLGVSPRTILRDIDRLSDAKVPVYTELGKGGGIYILDTYKLDKSVLTEEERETLRTALQCVSTALDPKLTDSVLTKLSSIAGKQAEKVIEIDFSAWGRRVEDQFETIKKSIREHKILKFDYVNTQGSDYNAMVEPYTLWFKEKTWYLKAYCFLNEATVVFRLSRMRNLHITEATFHGKRAEMEHHPDFLNPHKISITMKIDSSKKFRIYDDFTETEIIEETDDFVTVRFEKPNNEYTLQDILAYGKYATVLEPEHLRQKVQKELEEMLNTYKE